MAKTSLALYREHFVSKSFERLDLFEEVAERYQLERALYPGSFVHITPSLVIPNVTYVDTDRRCPRFFEDPAVREFVLKHKQYPGDPNIQYLAKDFTKALDLPDGAFDAVISQWTLPTSRCCKRYLRIGGVLLANNSHGDASLASLDDDYDLVGVVNRRGGRHTVSERGLSEYLIPKSGREVVREDIQRLGRGIGYTKSPAMYLFRRLA